MLETPTSLARIFVELSPKFNCIQPESVIVDMRRTHKLETDEFH